MDVHLWTLSLRKNAEYALRGMYVALQMLKNA